MGLTSLGVFHTLIGILSIFAGLFSFVKFGKIHLEKLSGRIYFYGTLITSLTALGISKHGGFNPGHGISIVILILIIVSLIINKKVKKPNARYFENFFLSLSFFLSMIPTTNETFTRIPVGNPLAKDVSDPLVVKTLGIILVLFIVGSIYQVIKQRKHNRIS